MRKHRPRVQSSVTPERVLEGYHFACFPMAAGRQGEINWYTAMTRTIVPLDERFVVRRSLRRTIRNGEWEIRVNSDFPAVIRACARHGEVPDDQVWLSEELIDIYIELHRLGYAHSVETWCDGSLVGGLYGIALCSAFFGESMFSRASSASQVALVALVERLRLRGYQLLDAQMRTPHIARFGAVDLTANEYATLLASALEGDSSFND